MRLKELSESVAKTCELPVRSVTRAQMETFRLLREAVEGGERIMIPGFGMFFLREVAAKDGKPAEKMIRLRVADAAANKTGSEADKTGAEKDKRADRAEKRAARRQNAEAAPETAE